MPDNGGPVPPGGEEEKIIIDGGLAGAVFEETCYSIKEFLASGRHLDQTGKIIKKLIKAENSTFEFQRAVIEGMGYHGEHGWPLCLMTVEEIKALP